MDHELSKLLDKEAIRDVLLRYVRGVDRCDEASIRAAFHPDAADEHGPVLGTVDGIVQWVLEHAATTEMVHHQVGNVLVELAGDRAVVETYGTAHHRFSADVEETHMGATPGGAVTQRMTTLFRYVDRFERRGDRWAISHRVLVMEDAWPLSVDSALPRDHDWVLARRDGEDRVWAALDWLRHDETAAG